MMAGAVVALSFLALGGCSASMGSPDAGACAAPAFDRSCTVATDCTVGVRHSTTCGGIEQLIGIRTTELAPFQAADTRCVAATSMPDGGCSLPADVVADDGSHSTLTSYAYYGLECRSGICTTTSSSATPGGCRCFQPQQTCNGGNGGCFEHDAGLGPSACVDVPAGCASCDCLAPDACGGTCIAVVPGVGAFCTC